MGSGVGFTARRRTNEFSKAWPDWSDQITLQLPVWA
jgi:hypothetical protein